MLCDLLMTQEAWQSLEQNAKEESKAQLTHIKTQWFQHGRHAIWSSDVLIRLYQLLKTLDTYLTCAT